MHNMFRLWYVQWSTSRQARNPTCSPNWLSWSFRSCASAAPSPGRLVICVYIYIHRERERERYHIYIYIYISYIYSIILIIIISNNNNNNNNNNDKVSCDEIWPFGFCSRGDVVISSERDKFSKSLWDTAYNIYIYIICIYVYIHMYIIVYINGVGTNGVTANFTFLTEGLFGYPRERTFIFPKVPGRTLFHMGKDWLMFIALAISALCCALNNIWRCFV